MGGQLLGWRTVCAVEVAPFPRRVLLARQRDGHLEPFPIWDDIRTFDGHPWRGHIDIITGGFPCKDISTSRVNAQGIDGEQSGLWSEMARIIGEVRPNHVLVENTPALTYRGLGRVLGDLAECGYDAEWSMFPAAAFGFPHQRQRVWIVAYPQCIRRNTGRNEIFINFQRLHSQRGTDALRWMVENAGSRDGSISRDLRNGNGIPGFMDRLRGLGNAIVPQIAEWIGRQIMKEVQP